MIRPQQLSAHRNPKFLSTIEGQLEEAPTVRQLVQVLEPIRTHDSCGSLLARFLSYRALYALPVIDASDKPVALVDRKQCVEFFSKSYAREIFARRSVRDLLSSADYESSEPIVVEENCSIEETAQLMINADMRHMVTGFLISSQGRYLGIANGQDLLKVITERKQAELHHLAHYDSLTGIPNRKMLSDRLQQACQEAERDGSCVALLFVDIDRFKQVNDSLGHSAGDAVLRTVVERLKATARRADTVARLSGDEFVILMERLSGPADVDAVAQRVVVSMREPIELLGHSLVVTVSIGSAIYPADDTRSSALLGKADAAMYEAKSVGRNSYRRYSPGMAMYNPASMLMENELRQAIERDELVLHFQPQVELASQRIVGAEALVRWCHPVRGLIPPVQFIPIAEASGLIVPLGEWVLRHALRQIKSWQQQGVPALRIAVNISALQVQQHRFSDFLEARLAEYEVDPRLIELELTESALMRNVDEVSQTLQEIKALGVSLAIDDFGTGFSSLSYLLRFPIDRLKIDQSFVRGIERLPVNQSVARAIIALANSLSLGVVAEGIEKSSERAMIEQLGCTEGQGYLFAKALPADVFSAFVAKFGESDESADCNRSDDMQRRLRS